MSSEKITGWVAHNPNYDFIGWEHVGYSEDAAIEALFKDPRINDRFDTWDSMLEVEPDWQIRPIQIVFTDEGEK